MQLVRTLAAPKPNTNEQPKVASVGVIDETVGQFNAEGFHWVVLAVVVAADLGFVEVGYSLETNQPWPCVVCLCDARLG